ncbi:MAG: cysteine desulfurase family protein [bacterium]|nr:cysteine desulfurase family protein [bacterium]
MNVYLDNAATTRIDPRVLKAMMPYLSEKYGNASSIHALGQDNNLILEQTRAAIAGLLKAETSGLLFTSGASEANNYILRGIMSANKAKGKHLVVSAIEHPSVLQTARELSRAGYELDIAPVDADGRVDLKALKKIVREDTALVSVMAVNNEIGTIQDLEAIAQIAHAKGAYFHSDIVQAIPYLRLDLKKMGIDACSLSAHKFYGPKGIGASYVRPGIKINNLISGGEQENGRRAGTYNLAGIVGMGTALELAYKERSVYLKDVKLLRDYLWKSLKKEIPEIKLNGGLKYRSANNLNIRFGRIEGEAILMDLSLRGIYVSTGSACSAHNLKSSSVLSAIGLADYDLNCNIRFTLGRFNNKKEIDYTVKNLKKTVARLRAFSPVK